MSNCPYCGTGKCSFCKDFPKPKKVVETKSKSKKDK